MRKVRKLVVLLAVIAVMAVNSISAFAQLSSHLDTSSVKTGLLNVSYENLSGKKIKLLVQKDASRYVYDLKADGSIESFSLQMGDGTYKVSIMVNVEGSKYRYVSTNEVAVDIEDENSVYLNSVQNVKWDKSSMAVKLAEELTADLDTDESKVMAIYDYIVRNISYDYSKYNNLSSDYLPDIDNILQLEKGICYDYSSLFAAMLRSVGIPAKLVTGYTENATGYHAWNEVYISGMGWVVIDSTYDAQMMEAGFDTEAYKHSGEYKKSYEF